ncbi:response regulator transcription factor [Desmospora profundinema]|uniref:OmpR family two-component system response regulator YxdJ n=1 Tax=Desmospora profundinema TaxID=1571184 RepID=A0ABU1IJZ2_9BACL|nr:response regulator transcription factor [Desmospora profundinema]MDR6224469.1 OmpR family two-component system response regulator YxdJ [Desmospora profundinema]
MYKILIVEDDPKMAGLLQAHLEKYGYDARLAEDFSAILESFEYHQPDLVLLDVNLPRFDGFYWCRQIRTLSTSPILFLSARDSKMDQVMALENGADDYITKPFDYEIVIAKIRSQLRRAYGSYSPKTDVRSVSHAGLALYPERLELTFEGKKVELSKKEAVLMEALMINPMSVVTREDLLEQLWDDKQFVADNTLNVNVARLRKRLKDLGIEDAIEAVRGVGYRLRPTWRDEG